jgi:hypothetical protein
LFTVRKTKNRFGEEAVWGQSDDIKRGNCVKWVLIFSLRGEHFKEFLEKSAVGEDLQETQNVICQPD